MLERVRERQTDRQRQRQTETETETRRQRDRDTERDSDRQTVTDRDTDRETQTEGQRERETETETELERQTETELERQTEWDVGSLDGHALCCLPTLRRAKTNGLKCSRDALGALSSACHQHAGTSPRERERSIQTGPAVAESCMRRLPEEATD